MLASLMEAPLEGRQFAYEPKYDGIRTIVELEPSGRDGTAKLYSRNGNDKTAQFPEIARDLRQFGRTLKAGVVLDGEVVALDERGEPAGFQHLQGRIHLTRDGEIGRAGGRVPVAFIAFDILRDGADDLKALPLSARRARLERVFWNTGSERLRLSEFVPADGRALYRRALEHGWEGLVVKHLDSRYREGQRTPDWRKLKITKTREFVVGGWTEPRGARDAFGALLLGAFDDTRLTYVGHTGTGFSAAELRRVWAMLRAVEIPRSPFAETPKSNERPHWTRPELVVQVRFSEWTADHKLRHPVYLGLRDDVDPRSVTRDETVADAPHARPAGATAPEPRPRPAAANREAKAASPRSKPRSPGRRRQPPVAPGPGSARTAPRSPDVRRSSAAVVDRLAALERSGRDGIVELDDGLRVKVGNLGKVFWPASGLTKGALLRYYAAVAPYILPVLDDRPLVMKRLPNGVRGKAFYQQRAPDDVPAGVRVATLPDDTEVPSRLIGGSLVSLLYMAQLASVSQDPWFSRVSSLQCPDFVALDLDPMPGVTFEQVLDVARWIREELDALGLPGFAKTSGADGLHVYVPLQAGTSYETALIFCQLVATLVAQKHPRDATVVRSVHARGRKVYVDYLQNVRGKTLAAAYSARASEFAGVSTPVTWAEVDKGFERETWTVDTVPARLVTVGDLWKGLRTSKGADLRAVVGKPRR